MDVLATVERVFQDVFRNQRLTITLDTKPSDVPGWDSLSTVNLIVAIEQAFSVSFKTKELRNLRNVGDIVSLLERKIPQV